MTRRVHPAVLLCICLISVLAVDSVAGTGRIEAERLFVEAQKALARGDVASAETLLMQSLERDDSFTSAIWQLSQIYEKRGQLEHARELLLRGLHQEPGASWARGKLAQLEKALTRDLLAEADALMGAGSYDKAIPKLSLFLGIRPFDPIPLIRLGRCHLALGNLETAREYVAQARERDPTDEDTAALLEEIGARIEEGSVAAAVAAAERILADYTPDHRDEARRALETVLERDPSNRWAAAKIEEIEDLVREAEPPRAVDLERIGQEGLERVRTLREPIAGIGVFVSRYLLILVIAAVGALLAIDIRKRTGRRSYPLEGSLAVIPLLDVVSMLNSNLKTGRLVVSTAESSGEIYLEKGEIVHARWRNTDGRDAFHTIMGRKRGTFRFLNHLPNVRHTIAEPLSLLLLSMKSNEGPAPVEPRPRRRVKLFS
ncbi:MAG: tetratricopeptide repeat protein [Candidatus Krumholzibacteriota bacterium]|nr:tetratricopeptide repeat protein [Candidatus Krumholzibacteriota bacterium]